MNWTYKIHHGRDTLGTRITNNPGYQSPRCTVIGLVEFTGNLLRMIEPHIGMSTSRTSACDFLPFARDVKGQTRC